MCVVDFLSFSTRSLIISHRGLLSLAVQVAMSLSLHRDPDKSPGKFTFFEAGQSALFLVAARC